MDKIELTSVTRMMYEASLRLEKASKKLFELAQKKAESEKVYRLSLMREIMQLREDKLPATLISDIARGKVADLKYQRDLDAELYKASLAALEALRSESSTLKAILEYQSEV
jgi:hypothetical protein